MTVPIRRDVVEACLYLVGDDIERRTRYGHPVPTMLRDLHRRLALALSGHGRETAETDSTPTQFETTAEKADRLGVTPRTIRRRAQASGARRVGHQWIFERETP